MTVTGPAEPSVSLEAVHKYAKDIKQAVKWYYEINNPIAAAFTDDQRINLVRLERLGWPDAQPLVIAALASGASGDSFSALLRALERLMFFSTMRPYTSMNVSLVEMAIDLRNKTVKVDAITSKLDHAANELNILESPVFSGASDSRSYYGWRAIRYFLFEYEQQFKNQSMSTRDKIEWDSFASEDYGKDFTTVEHIFPQRAVGDYWDKHFKGYNSPQRAALRNTLGNLLALSRPKNSSLGRKPFPAKREGIGESPGYRMGSYSEIEVSKLEDWTPQEIERRGFEMLKFFERRWRVSLGDPSVKQRLLNLEFLRS